MENINESELIEFLKTGGVKIMEEIYMRYSQRMKIAAKRILINDAEVDDLVQEILIDLWVKRKSRKISSLSGYLIGAVWNKSRSLLSKQVREDMKKSEYAKVMSINSRKAASRARRLKQLEANLEKMPEGIDRDIFDALIDGEDYEKIATIFNVTVPHVKYVRAKYIRMLKDVSSGRKQS
jgi:RNA polymerase sigma factor (sigma-70 family)